jgi:hypothetical protein
MPAVKVAVLRRVKQSAPNCDVHRVWRRRRTHPRKQGPQLKLELEPGDSKAGGDPGPRLARREQAKRVPLVRCDVKHGPSCMRLSVRVHAGNDDGGRVNYF